MTTTINDRSISFIGPVYDHNIGYLNLIMKDGRLSLSLVIKVAWIDQTNRIAQINYR